MQQILNFESLMAGYFWVIFERYTLVDRKRYILLTLFYYLTIKQTLSLLWTERLEDILAPRNNATAKKCAEVRFGTPHHQNSHKM